jgi:hypothetical protein
MGWWKSGMNGRRAEPRPEIAIGSIRLEEEGRKGKNPPFPIPLPDFETQLNDLGLEMSARLLLSLLGL